MNLDHRNWFKKCRVCNKEGSRNIFEKITRTQLESSSSLQSVSSNTRLLEKLRYVTMMKVRFEFFLRTKLTPFIEGGGGFFE